MTPAPRRIAVTGAAGRLGRSLLLAADHHDSVVALPWARPELDLDRPLSAVALLDRDRPDLVVHAAAWTDVDGCAREPGLALARNGEATGVLARACAERGVGLVVVSTNEVFDGARTDGLGYVETDEPRPINPYGASKLAGEEAARAAFSDAPGLWITRVAWLYGPFGGDFPERIVRVADRLAPGASVGLVADETGNPTCTTDLAGAILTLIAGTSGGTWHLASGPPASRAELGRAVLAQLRPDRATHDVSRASFQRDSTPPAWGVLDTGLAAAQGISMRPWPVALREELGRRAGAEPEATPKG